MLKRHIYEPEHEMFRDAVRKFVEQEIAPHHETWEHDGRVPHALWLKAGAQGLLCPQVPEEYGGPGGDYRYLAIVDEELCLYTGCSTGFAVHSDIVGSYILNHGSEEQKKAWLPKMVSGEVIAGIAMTEPNTGSDLQAVKTSAILTGNEYVLNGSKTFISNGQNGHLFVVVAKTNPAEKAQGISLVLVEGDQEGFKRGRNLDKIGLKAQDTSELFFDNVRVPTSNLLGEEGKGFVCLMQELPQERLALAIGAVSAAQKIFDITVDYVKERKAFGQPIAAFQNTRFKLAELKTELQVGWAFLDKCIDHHLRGELEPAEAAMIKLWTSEMQGRVVDECLQLHGGYGYMTEYAVARAYRDARIQRIYGGTSEIMKELIARSI